MFVLVLVISNWNSLVLNGMLSGLISWVLLRAKPFWDARHASIVHLWLHLVVSAESGEFILKNSASIWNFCCRELNLKDRSCDQVAGDWKQGFVHVSWQWGYLQQMLRRRVLRMDLTEKYHPIIQKYFFFFHKNRMGRKQRKTGIDMWTSCYSIFLWKQNVWGTGLELGGEGSYVRHNTTEMFSSNFS